MSEKSEGQAKSAAQPTLAFSIPTSSDAEQRKLFDGFAPAGFAALELKGGQYARFVGEPQRFRDAWGDGRPGACAGLIYGGGLDEDGVASLRRVIAFANAIDARMVVFCHGRARATVEEEDLRQFAQQLSRIGEEAQAHGVKLSLHHHFDQPVMHRPDFDVFFGAATPGAVGLTVDTAHLVKSGITDVAGVIRDFAPFIDNIHLKDFADGDWRTLGKGAIDFAPLFATLHEIDFRGYLCADEESGAGVGASLQASIDFLRRGWDGT